MKNRKQKAVSSRQQKQLSWLPSAFCLLPSLFPIRLSETRNLPLAGATKISGFA
jgi:hypothetical protein